MHFLLNIHDYLEVPHSAESAKIQQADDIHAHKGRHWTDPPPQGAVHTLASSRASPVCADERSPGASREQRKQRLQAP